MSHHHPVNRGALHLTMMGRECSWLDPSYQRHITFACTGCYQLHLYHRLGIITPDLLPVPIYRPERMDSLVSKGRLYAHNLCPRLLHNWIQRYQKEMNPGCRVPDQLNTNEPTVPYIIGRKLNLRKLSGWQWESNPQPSEQLWLVAIKTSSSTETATTAYIRYSARLITFVVSQLICYLGPFVCLYRQTDVFSCLLVWQYVCLNVWMFVCLCLCPTADLYECVSLSSLYVYLYVCLFACCLSVFCPFVWILSICLW